MPDKEILADIYRQQGHSLAAHLGDFSEGDMLVRPAEKANHAAWQLGHLVGIVLQVVMWTAPVVYVTTTLPSWMAKGLHTGSLMFGRLFIMPCSGRAYSNT